MFSMPCGRCTKDERPRPQEPSSTGDRDLKLQTRALQDIPTGNQVRQSFTRPDGVSQVTVKRVYDFQAPY